MFTGINLLRGHWKENLLLNNLVKKQLPLIAALYLCTWFVGMPVSKHTVAAEYCFSNYSLIGIWSDGAKVRCETKKEFNKSQSTSVIFIKYDSNNTDYYPEQQRKNASFCSLLIILCAFPYKFTGRFCLVGWLLICNHNGCKNRNKTVTLCSSVLIFYYIFTLSSNIIPIIVFQGSGG